MEIYLRECEDFNDVVVTDRKTVKFLENGFSKGCFEGVDLYAKDTIERLHEHFKEIDEAGNMNDYNDIWAPLEFDFNTVKEELENTALVYMT